jgi:hypothetical protein
LASTFLSCYISFGCSYPLTNTLSVLAVGQLGFGSMVAAARLSALFLSGLSVLDIAANTRHQDQAFPADQYRLKIARFN